jgi:hypothetical protein
MKQIFSKFSAFCFPFPILMALLLLASCKPEVPEPTPMQEKIETPRRIAAHGGKIYVTCYRPASVIRIDTATRQVESVCKLGNYNPEGVAVAGGRLFVASSWNTAENGDYLYDDKVYVVDLASFTVSGTVSVGANPQQVKVVDDEHVIVNYNGNYSDIPGGTAIIDVNTLAVSQTGQEMTGMSVWGGKVYGYSVVYDASWNPMASFVCYDIATMSAVPLLEGSGIGDPYSISVVDSAIYVTTHSNYVANGDVVCFGMDGTLRWRCEAGLLPSKVEPLGDGAALVVNEGTWGGNNASLSRVNLGTGAIVNGVFAAANGRGLGDVAQDVVVYGTKAYIAVSFSNTVEVLNLSDDKSVQIKL